MSKRNVLAELMEGFAAMKGHRQGKLTLRTWLHCSRAVVARRLRINERTLENWKQGRGRPNPHAAALVLLVREYPDALNV